MGVEILSHKPKSFLDTLNLFRWQSARFFLHLIVKEEKNDVIMFNVNNSKITLIKSSI